MKCELNRLSVGNSWALGLILISSIAFADGYYDLPMTSGQVKIEISARLHQVPELALIQQYARQNGIKVFLAGSSAADLAYYVRQDLENEWSAQHHQTLKFQKSRYDYSFFNVFERGKPVEILVQGTEAQRTALEHYLKQEIRFAPAQNLFVPQVSVRIASPEFIETGKWIEVSQSVPDSFVSSSLTAEVARTSIEINPMDIGSVLEQMVYASHFGITISNPQQLSSAIQSWNPAETTSLDQIKKIQELALELFSAPMDLAETVDWIRETGLQKKMLEFERKHLNYDINSMYQKEPLRNLPLGKEGQSASELGIQIIAHGRSRIETLNSISSSPTGRVNGFISRRFTWGELAVNGDGFYTYRGEKGGAFAYGYNDGLALTHKMRVLPNSRSQHDFSVTTDKEIVIKNGSAVENLPFPQFSDITQFFDSMENRTLTRDDTAYYHAFRSTLAYKLNHLDAKSISKIESLVKEKIKASHTKKPGEPFSPSIEEWFSWDASFESKGLLEEAIQIDAERALTLRAAYDGPNWKQYLDLALKQKSAETAIRYYLSKPEVQNEPDYIQLIDEFAQSDNAHWVISYILSRPEWFDVPQFGKWMDQALLNVVYKAPRPIKEGFFHPKLLQHPHFDFWIRTLLDPKAVQNTLTTRMLGSRTLYEDERFGSWMDLAIQNRPYQVADLFRKTPHLSHDPRFLDWIKALIRNGNDVNSILTIPGLIPTPLFDEILEYQLDRPEARLSADSLAWAVAQEKPKAKEWLTRAMSRPTHDWLHSFLEKMERTQGLKNTLARLLGLDPAHTQPDDFIHAIGELHSKHCSEILEGTEAQP